MYTNYSGKVYTPDKLYVLTNRKTGRPYCIVANKESSTILEIVDDADSYLIPFYRNEEISKWFGEPPTVNYDAITKGPYSFNESNQKWYR